MHLYVYIYAYIYMHIYIIHTYINDLTTYNHIYNTQLIDNDGYINYDFIVTELYMV